MCRLGALALTVAVILGCTGEERVASTTVPTAITRIQLSPRARQQGAQPIFYRYEVKDGDTVDVLAARFDVRPEYIRWNNPGLETGEPSRGTLLVIPSRNGLVHELRLGETLSEIADRYGVSLDVILAEPSSGLVAGAPAPTGGTLLIPGGRPPAP
ncbi:MAG: LysM peptidoglycan-binding domain-containing protein [Dehalococcoidia bacterium]